jgi:hypothetical protein
MPTRFSFNTDLMSSVNAHIIGLTQEGESTCVGAVSPQANIKTYKIEHV